MNKAVNTPITGVMLTALFHDARATERAYEVAIARGYQQSDISLVMSDETRRHQFSSGSVVPELVEKAKQSAESKPGDAKELGGPAGGAVGTIAPAAAAIGTALLLPGLIFARPIAVALAAAGAVGLAGGIA